MIDVSKRFFELPFDERERYMSQICMQLFDMEPISTEGYPMQDFVSLAIFSCRFEPNGHDHGTEANALRTLDVSKDHIQVGMAANLKEFVLTNCDDQEVSVSSPRFQDEPLISELHRRQKTLCWETSISIGFCKLITVKETHEKMHHRA